MNQQNKRDGKALRNPLRMLLSREAEEGYVPNRELFLSGLGLCGETACSNFIATWMFYFCTDILKVDTLVVGIITSLSRIWDGINDPIVGAYLDKRPHSPGKKFHANLTRLPPIIGIIGALMFTNLGLSPTMTVVVFVVLYLMWDLLFSVQDVSAWGTLALISPHSAERGRATQWLYIGANGGPAACALVPLLMGMRETLGLSEKTLFFIFGIVFCFGGEMLSILTGNAKERVSGGNVQSENESLFAHIAALRENKMMLLLVASQILAAVTPAIGQIYFFKYMSSYQIGSFTLNGETTMFIYNLLVATPGTLAMFFANKASKKLGGMKNVIVYGQLLAIVMRFITFFVGYKSVPQLIVFMVLMTIGDFPTLTKAIAVKAMWCDSIDYMEWKTGKRTEAIAFSLQGLVGKISTAISGFIAGAILKALKYNADIESLTGQAPIFYKAQWPLYILGPLFGAVLSLIPVLFIKYSDEQRETVEKELRERKETVAQLEKVDEIKLI